MNGGSLYAGKRVALLTQHGKEHAIAPILEPALACRVERVTGYDTDRLGTFTRDIPRLGTQLDAARKKARIGMELAGGRLGLASEGSFGTDPFAGMFPWNVEVLMFLDDELGIEVCGIFQGPGRCDQQLTGDWAAAQSFARKAGFPAHHLVLRPDHGDDPRIRKGIADWDSFATAYEAARGESATGQVFVEHDLRAHAHPTRMDNIRQAARDLLARLQSSCPACGAPGFAVVENVPGLPCADCGAPTHETQSDVLGCVRCGHRVTRDRALKFADPGRCDWCNP